MAIGHGEGKDKAKEAANAVITSPLLETSIEGARRLLINISMSEDVLSSDVDVATKMITDKAADDVEFIFGTSFKEDMQDEMTITVIAAGFDNGDSDALPEDAADSTELPSGNIPPITNGTIPEPKKQPAKKKQPVVDEDLVDIFKILDKK